jgi:hypothetical protein
MIKVKILDENWENLIVTYMPILPNIGEVVAYFDNSRHLEGIVSSRAYLFNEDKTFSYVEILLDDVRWTSE